MFRTLATCALVVAGVALIVTGYRRWTDQRAVRGTVDAYMNALKQGDRVTLLSLLDPQQRATVENQPSVLKDDFWRAHPGVANRVHHIDVVQDSATARLWIEKDGFVLQPVMHLHRSETGLWKIGRIENLKVDPLWNDLQRERRRAQDDKLAAELARALEHSAGVRVERVPLDVSRQ